jgi:large repetitive protein
MRRAKRLLVVGLVGLELALLAGAAGAAADNRYGATVAPSAVVPSASATYTIALTNRSTASVAANNGHVAVPAGFTVDAGTLAATTSGAGSCSSAQWTVALDGSPIAIHAVAPPGPASALCPGATLRIRFAAKAPTAERSYTWTTKLAHDATAFELDGTQPKVAVDGTPPPTPTISQHPTDPSNSSAASFTFADGDATATLLCRLDAAAFTACTSPTGYAGVVDGAHRFAVKAVDAAGNESAASSYNWTVDLTPPPAPKLTSQPGNVTASTSASFAFTDDDATASYFCKLDGAAFGACTSPKAYAGLSVGQHVFAVKARDPAGNEGAMTSYTWSIDLTNPVVTIDPASEPSDPTNNASAKFAFSSNKSDSSFACAFDGAPFAACTSPVSYSALANARHSFAVRATDSKGTTGPASVWNWTVDTIPPAAPIVDSAPRSPTNSPTASVTFHDGEAGLLHSCRIDGGGFGACSSPTSYSDLADGSHTFAVRATDAAGNVGPESSRGWVVDTQAPHTTITRGPTAVSSNHTAVFAFTSNEPSSFSCSLDGGSSSSCSSPRSYGGLPEGEHTFHAQATDLAGNTDAPPPAYSWRVVSTDTRPPAKVKRLRMSVRYGYMSLRWLPTSATVFIHVRVQRSQSARGEAQTVYDGAGRRYVDRRFENGEFFIYRVRSYDQNGNASGSASAAVSAGALLRSPRDGGVVRTSTTQLIWTAVPKATYYNVQLYRGAQKVLSAWPLRPRLALLHRWVYQGRQLGLSKGSYRWYVWPGFGPRPRAVYGHLLGTATFAAR